MADSFYVIIVGCGRLGGLLANHLSSLGHSVVAIDNREKAFSNNLNPEYSGFQILADAVEVSVLQQANIQDADYFFACTAQDNVNLMVAQIAKTIFKVPNVFARVYDPAREALYAEFQIQTVSPIHLATNALLKKSEPLARGKYI